MSTSNPTEPTGSPFTEAEVEAATGPRADPELDEVAPAEIDEGAQEQDTPFEKLVSHAKRLNEAQVRNLVESVLFVAPTPLSVDQLFEATGVDQVRLHAALASLREVRLETGVVLHEVSGGWQLRTSSSSAECVRRFLKVKPQRLTRAALETMAIVAYRQPVTRPEIEDIRGVDSGAVVKALLDRRLIKIVGKKEEVGRPILYGTTREFLEFFALKDLSALPTLREFHELTEEHQDIVEQETGKPGVDGTVAALSDPGFEDRLKATDAAAEAALTDLESAIDTAEETAKAAAKVLDPPAPPENVAAPQGPPAGQS